jgi:elongator complex protein 1
VVAFFEKNGLQHGELDLRVGGQEQLRVRELEWNCDSTVLAVWAQSKEGNGSQ